MANIPGTNSGHGHVWERPDGIKARCGGPALCAKCRTDQTVAMGPDKPIESQSNKELREQVRDRFAGLTGTYDGADAMADLAIDLLHSHMQTAFDEQWIFNSDHNESDDYKRGFQDALEQFEAALKKRSKLWLGGDK